MQTSAQLGRGLSLGILAVAVAACSYGETGKSGATAERPATLTLEMPDAGDTLGTAFAETVRRRSKGAIQVKIASGYSSARPANEVELAKALSSGRADLAYMPARAWSAAGIPAFQALLAPFVITTVESAHALASGPLARDVLAALPADVVGLALVPSEPRRVLAVRPPVELAALRGLRIRIADDPQTAATFEALGTTVVEQLDAAGTRDALTRRALDGVESAPEYILDNSYWSDAPHLSGYGVFPKFQAIVVGRAAWDRLSAAQRDVLRASAEEAVVSAAASIATQERSELAELCRAGVQVAVPTARQLERLVAAARPAVDALAADPAIARLLAAMRRLPGAGPRPLASPLPETCAGAAPEPPRRADPQGAGPALPEGTYEVTVTPEQFQAAGAGAAKHRMTWTVRTRFRDGRWTQTVAPAIPDECPPVATRSDPACSGTYRVDGDELKLTWTHPAEASETLRWSYFDGVLRFEPVDVGDPSERAIFAQPWRKVG